MLEGYQKAQTPVVMTLQNKIRVVGRIKAFDNYVVIIEGPKKEVVYRHAVSSVTTHTGEEKKRDPGNQFPSPKSQKQASTPQKSQDNRNNAVPADAKNLNTTLQDGLLKWMQDRKAAK